MRVFMTIGVGVALLSVTGCVWPRGDSPPVHTYQLSLDHADGGTGASRSHGPVLVVGLPQAAPGFESPRMVYLTRPYEMESFAVNQWAESPARLLAPLLVQSLSETSGWRVVVPEAGAVRGDYRLDLDDVVVQQEFLQQPSQVRMRWRAQLIDSRELRVMDARVFEVLEPASSDDAYGGVLAANRAVRQLLNQLGQWLHERMPQRPGTNRP